MAGLLIDQCHNDGAGIITAGCTSAADPADNHHRYAISRDVRQGGHTMKLSGSSCFPHTSKSAALVRIVFGAV
jgi:hypothetical protein